MIHDFNLFKIAERRAAKGWRSVLEGTRRLMGLYTRVLLCVLGRLSKGHCLAIYSMSREIVRLYRRSGARFTGMYLKQVSFLLMQYVGSSDSQHAGMKTFVSLTRSGLPRFIPPMYRKIIRAERDPYVIQIVLSICTLSRLLKVTPAGGMRVSPDPAINLEFQLKGPGYERLSFWAKYVHDFVGRYSPEYRKIPLKLGFNLKPMFSSGPNTHLKPERVFCGDREGIDLKFDLSIYHTLPLDCWAIAIGLKPSTLSMIGSVFFCDQTWFAGDGIMAGVRPVEDGTRMFRSFLALMTLPIGGIWSQVQQDRPVLGRFGAKLEGSGKLRIFTIVNPILQCLLRPLHDWCMDVLRTIRMDGTFDQLRPLSLLSGKRILYSIDLKSATDLLPIAYSDMLLLSLFGGDLSEAWAVLLQEIRFMSPDRRCPGDRRRLLRFTRGQPLGCYSSWPVFTLTHHMFVWEAADLIYPGKVFRDYAILGDDLVIADERVALEYMRIMDESEVIISKEKSLISFKGACEFAKRFIIHNHRSDRLDISPLSLPLIKLCTGHASAFVFKKLNCSFRNSFRLRGGGYRVFSKVDNLFDTSVFDRMSKRWKRHWLSMHTPSGIAPLPLRFWLVYPRKGVLSCYEEGLARSFILDRIRPRELKLEEFRRLERFWISSSRDFLDGMLKSYLSLHLEYLSWYASAMSSYTLQLDELVRPPISPRGLARPAEEDFLARYGLIFKVWDFLRSHPAPLGVGWDQRSTNRTCIYTLSDPHCPAGEHCQGTS